MTKNDQHEVAMAIAKCEIEHWRDRALIAEQEIRDRDALPQIVRVTLDTIEYFLREGILE